MKRRLGLAALALWGLAARGAPAAEVETLRDSGPAPDRFNIAVLGDGYRTEDQTKLTTDAQGIIDYVFGVTPLAQYGAFFNVKLVHVVSNENGADNGSYGATRDTALGAYFDCDDIERLLCVDDGKVAVAAAQDVPEYNFAIVIVNDPKYGGSGGPVCASSSNEQSFDILAHEIGHSLARLADEYSYEGNQPPCNQQQDCPEANATLRTSLEQIKWKDWIEAGTPLPTPATAPYADVTGLFEGTRYAATGVYRPQQTCKMRDLAANYCAVCAEQFVRSIWTSDNVKMIESSLPDGQTVQSASCDAVEMSVKSPPISPSTYRYTWTVDGQPQGETSHRFSLVPGAFAPGEHDVAVRVEDATPLVRTDLDNVLKDQVSWQVTLTKADCPVPAGEGGAGGVAGGGGTTSGAGSVTGGSAAAVAGAASFAGGGAAPGPGNGGAGVGTAAAHGNPPPRETSSCGCAVPVQGSRLGTGVVALALALLLGRRRGRTLPTSDRS